jgi:hypothetical protein
MFQTDGSDAVGRRMVEGYICLKAWGAGECEGRDCDNGRQEFQGRRAGVRVHHGKYLLFGCGNDHRENVAFQLQAKFAIWEKLVLPYKNHAAVMALRAGFLFSYRICFWPPTLFLHQMTFWSNAVL